MLQIIIDTNVLISGFKSSAGASFQLLRRLKDPRWQVNLSSALVLEYEEQLRQASVEIGLDAKEISQIIEDLCSISKLHSKLPFNWRAISRDPDDDFILELAIHANADIIISYNKHDISIVTKYGIAVLTPLEFLIKIGAL
ncbi:MAG: putative toxin-antitoxin system toxin component, PIN family [Anaerolineae bacterium]|nr:putative toxin-antitoxin system toxin component, PIN family [Anaerolineae bacterium]